MKWFFLFCFGGILRVMKRILSFIVIYVASILVCTLVFATLFMFSCNLSMFVTGTESSFFSLQFFLNGVLLSLPLSCVLIQVLLVFYLIRHPSQHILSLVFYLVFGAISWLVLVPTDLHLISRYESDLITTRLESSSAGVFRKEESGVFYYSRIDEDGSADGIFFDTTGFSGSEGEVIPFFDMPVKNESAFPYSDILIKNALQPSPLVTYPLAVYNALLTAGAYSASLGFISWLAFASLGLALLAVYGVQFLSSWKLANVISVFVVVLAIVAVNYLYYMNILPAPLKEVAAKLSEFTGAKDPLIILVNLIFAVLLTAFGIFMGIYRYGTSLSDSEIEE